MNLLNLYIKTCFCAGIVAIVLFGKSLSDPKIPPNLTNALLSGSDEGFPVPGSEIEPLRKLLPMRGAISFLSDKQFGVDVEMERFYHDTQNYLCPLILNPYPGEKIGIAIFSNPETAHQRLQEINYSWLVSLADSKGVAQKNI